MSRSYVCVTGLGWQGLRLCMAQASCSALFMRIFLRGISCSALSLRDSAVRVAAFFEDPAHARVPGSFESFSRSSCGPSTLLFLSIELIRWLTA